MGEWDAANIDKVNDRNRDKHIANKDRDLQDARVVGLP
jgi:hypothetical protein